MSMYESRKARSRLRDGKSIWGALAVWDALLSPALLCPVRGRCKGPTDLGLRGPEVGINSLALVSRPVGEKPSQIVGTSRCPSPAHTQGRSECQGHVGGAKHLLVCDGSLIELSLTV